MQDLGLGLHRKHMFALHDRGAPGPRWGPPECHASTLHISVVSQKREEG